MSQASQLKGKGESFLKCWGHCSQGETICEFRAQLFHSVPKKSRLQLKGDGLKNLGTNTRCKLVQKQFMNTVRVCGSKHQLVDVLGQ